MCLYISIAVPFLTTSQMSSPLPRFKASKIKSLFSAPRFPRISTGRVQALEGWLSSYSRIQWPVPSHGVHLPDSHMYLDSPFSNIKNHSFLIKKAQSPGICLRVRTVPAKNAGIVARCRMCPGVSLTRHYHHGWHSFDVLFLISSPVFGFSVFHSPKQNSKKSNQSSPFFGISDFPLTKQKNKNKWLTTKSSLPSTSHHKWAGGGPGQSYGPADQIPSRVDGEECDPKPARRRVGYEFADWSSFHGWCQPVQSHCDRRCRSKKGFEDAEGEWCDRVPE